MKHNIYAFAPNLQLFLPTCRRSRLELCILRCGEISGTAYDLSACLTLSAVIEFTAPIVFPVPDFAFLAFRGTIVSTVVSESVFPLNNPKPTLWSRFQAWRDRPVPVTIESILLAAEEGQLDHHLTQHYTIYYHEHWKEKLLLCRDLVIEGLLIAEFDDDFDGTPIFLKKNARITIAGREHLDALRQKHFSRRFWTGAIGFVTGIISTLAVQLIQAWIESNIS